MIVKFIKGGDKTRPEVWASSNLFALADNKKDSRRQKLKKLVKILKQRGVKSKIESFYILTSINVEAVCIDTDKANEAYFLLLASNGGIEI